MRRYYKNSLTAALSKKLPEKAFWLDIGQIDQLKTGAGIVLALAAVAGVVAIALMAPNVLKLCKHVPALRRSLRKSNNPSQKIARTFYYLKRRGYIKLIPKGEDVLVELTQAGKKRILKMNYEQLKIPISKDWDKKWWYVLADIPTKEFRGQADSLRGKIRRLGLFPLQRTVWVYPHDPTDQIAFVAGRLQIERFVTILRADKIDEDDHRVLSEHFKIKA